MTYLSSSSQIGRPQHCVVVTRSVLPQSPHGEAVPALRLTEGFLRGLADGFLVVMVEDLRLPNSTSTAVDSTLRHAFNARRRKSPGATTDCSERSSPTKSLACFADRHVHNASSGLR